MSFINEAGLSTKLSRGILGRSFRVRSAANANHISKAVRSLQVFKYQLSNTHHSQLPRTKTQAHRNEIMCASMLFYTWSGILKMITPESPPRNKNSSKCWEGSCGYENDDGYALSIISQKPRKFQMIMLSCKVRKETATWWSLHATRHITTHQFHDYEIVLPN